MGHGHGHGHTAGRAGDRRRLRLVLLITAAVLVVQLVGAWVSGSLALLADAGHMATDAAGVLLALGASYVAALPSTRRFTFGWHRAEVLAALVNALVLVALCVYLAVAGVSRLLEPTGEVAPVPMIAFAVVGLVANAASLAILTRSGTGSINLRGATMEVLADTLGSVVVVVAGVVIWATGFERADPLGSLVIAAMILPRAASLAKEALVVLLEVAPAGLALEEVREHLLGMPGVVDVHDLHAWTITTGLPSMSAHVTVTDEVLASRGVGAVLDDLSHCTTSHFAVHHATFQVEPESHRAHEDLGEAH
ncbi:cation diffusion facilitator family transporter [Nocardioides sp. CFH 31398]|uniref:cation diffusion facilitator family transporter n=1 Tax=Nocardioides sp. CFH 31398 TaxID=2919579 RepID=UPI001F051B1D|nr:cation diffusion facilitator family transporter [Nocardioides sp. CFH 31398]MCH1864914.1 cation diffusion facilitator family transporter [Nocardioides sp. CFH 31398]